MNFGRNLNLYELHKTLINQYYCNNKQHFDVVQNNGSTSKQDMDIIKENHKFLWNDEEKSTVCSWEQKLAKKYYDKLYKEYCIADLTLYKENKIGLRWRTEQELINGKGQFICGGKNCVDKIDLKSWEVNFGYKEQGVKKNALVKLRLCINCSKKLNYHHQKKEVKRFQNCNSKFNAKCENTNSRSCNTKSYSKNKSKLGKYLFSNKACCLSQNSEKNVWNFCSNSINVKTREEEFDEYLSQLFL